MDASSQQTPAKDSSTAETTVVAETIRGRVDAIAEGRIQGWAWHPAKSAERLKIEVVRNGTIIASATSDQARIDLRRNGVGDGSHAFDFKIDPAVIIDDSIVFRAVAADGESQALRVASTDERAAEAAVSVPLDRVLERLDLLLTVQRQLAIGQRDTLAGTKSLTERVGTLSAEGGSIDTAVAKVSESQADLVSRVASIEVFLTRFDNALGGFDRRLSQLQTVGRNEVKPLIIILATILGFVAGVVLMAFVR